MHCFFLTYQLSIVRVLERGRKPKAGRRWKSKDREWSTSAAVPCWLEDTREPSFTTKNPPTTKLHLNYVVIPPSQPPSHLFFSFAFDFISSELSTIDVLRFKLLLWFFRRDLYLLLFVIQFGLTRSWCHRNNDVSLNWFIFTWTYYVSSSLLF